MRKLNKLSIIILILLITACGGNNKTINNMDTEKKNIGSVLALYPTPETIVATIINEKVNFMMLSHICIIGHDRIMISMRKPHFINTAVRVTLRSSLI